MVRSESTKERLENMMGMWGSKMAKWVNKTGTLVNMMEM